MKSFMCVDFKRKRLTRKTLRAHVERLGLSCLSCLSLSSLRLLFSHFGISSAVAACSASDTGAVSFSMSGVDQRSVCPCLHCCLTTECEAGLEQQQQQLQLSADWGGEGGGLKDHELNVRKQLSVLKQFSCQMGHYFFLRVENAAAHVLFSAPPLFKIRSNLSFYSFIYPPPNQSFGPCLGYLDDIVVVMAGERCLINPSSPLLVVQQIVSPAAGQIGHELYCAC